jgi:hypothetical protein
VGAGCRPCSALYIAAVVAGVSGVGAPGTETFPTRGSSHAYMWVWTLRSHTGVYVPVRIVRPVEDVTKREHAFTLDYGRDTDSC